MGPLTGRKVPGHGLRLDSHEGLYPAEGKAAQEDPWPPRASRISCLDIGHRVKSGGDGEWCNGSTADSGSACLGSNPSSPTKLSNLTQADTNRQQATTPDENGGCVVF